MAAVSCAEAYSQKAQRNLVLSVDVTVPPQCVPDVCFPSNAGSHLTISSLGGSLCCFSLDSMYLKLCMLPEALKGVATQFLCSAYAPLLFVWQSMLPLLLSSEAGSYPFAGLLGGRHWYSSATDRCLAEQRPLHILAWLPHAVHGADPHL